MESEQRELDPALPAAERLGRRRLVGNISLAINILININIDLDGNININLINQYLAINIT
jgi:hypothetical protein